MTATESEFDLAGRIRSLLATYIRQRAEAKSGKKWDKAWTEVDQQTGKRQHRIPNDYREAEAKVCQEAFLTMRSCRTRDDFVRYFVNTICAGPRFMPDYAELATVLLAKEPADGGENWEDIKSLAMLSASSMWPSVTQDSRPGLGKDK